jgi:hypothetical protein
MEEKTITITYRFAKYKYEFLLNLGYTQRAEVFKLMMQELCEHEFEEVPDEYNAQVCKKCGLFDLDWVENVFRCDCSNCRHLDVEGGDIVPYGSTTTTTPEYEICDADIPEENQTDEFYKSIMHNPNCPYWKGKEAKKGKLFYGI